MNLYFDLADPQVISDLESLLSLNVKKTYYRHGDPTPVVDIASTISIPHSTAGIFRGQLHDWPLIPKCFRGISADNSDKPIVRSFQWRRATDRFWSFCERAEVQNPAFPARVSDRMSIAQHFGVPTPLLDWSANIFAAVFFAIREVFADAKFDDSLKVFVYHVIDERLLHPGIPDVKLSEFALSAFVKPYAIDRRIERQRAAFTYHPYPTHRAAKVPVRKYVLEWPMIEKLIHLMRGFGFTEDYFFPDYSGIANAVNYDTSL